MLTLLLLCCLRPPQAPLPPQGPPMIGDAPAACRCGSGCPAGKDCGASCACAARPPQPGPEWQWDAEGGFWWRYGPATAAPASLGSPTPWSPGSPAPATFTPAPALTPAPLSFFRPTAAPRAAAANC